MKGILTGIVTRKKDDGKFTSMLYLTQIGFNDYDNTAEVHRGFKTAEVYVARAVDAEPGDMLNIDYEPGFQGKAQVSDIQVLKKGPKS